MLWKNLERTPGNWWHSARSRWNSNIRRFPRAWHHCSVWFDPGFIKETTDSDIGQHQTIFFHWRQRKIILFVAAPLTYEPCCVGTGSQNGSAVCPFQVQARKRGIFFGMVGGALCRYTNPKALWDGREKTRGWGWYSAKWVSIWAKWDPIWPIHTKVGTLSQEMSAALVCKLGNTLCQCLMSYLPKLCLELGHSHWFFIASGKAFGNLYSATWQTGCKGFISSEILYGVWIHLRSVENSLMGFAPWGLI